MDYRLRIGDQLYPVEAGPRDAEGRGEMTVDGRPCSVKVESVSSQHVRLSMCGKAANLYVVPDGQGAWIWHDGRARLVEDADKIEPRKSRGPGVAASEVTPPTPGSVVRVLVQQGQTVEKGQALVVISAMKMEMTLSAPYAGTVRAVNAQMGAQVAPGQILVEIDPREEVEE
ncbi:MAG: biotin/lipoyl-binding protein [Desulfomonile tiedjei]|nr:biotin/lipoyl-binding protein [Desulfomonile tiedjei]